jgi:hypothetical protein
MKLKELDEGRRQKYYLFISKKLLKKNAISSLFCPCTLDGFLRKVLKYEIEKLNVFYQMPNAYIFFK